MLPDLTFLIALLLGFLAPTLRATTPGTALLGTGASFLVAWALVRLMADRAQAAVEREQPLAALALRAWLALPVLAAWFASLAFFGWRQCVLGALPEGAAFVAWLLVFVPLVLAFAVLWTARARIEGALAAVVGRPGAAVAPRHAVSAGLKRNAFALIPMFVLLGLRGGLDALAALGVPGLPTVTRWVDDLPQAGALLTILVLGLLGYFLPALLARMLPSEPFPAGPLKDTLERLAATMSLRYRQMRVWKTGGRGLNAMVVGLTAGTRRIFVTDGLLRSLPPDEVQAVFCHEAAHAQRRHLLWFLVLTATLTLADMLLDDPLRRMGLDELSRGMLYLAALWFGVLGWISRRFEREADVDGGDHAALLEPDLPPHPVPSLPAPLPEGALRMVKALKRLEGMVGPVSSHRHGTLADRASFVAIHATHPEVRADFARRMRRMRWGFAAVGVGLLAWAGARLPADLALADAVADLRRGSELYVRAFAAADRDPGAAAGDWGRAAEHLRRAAEALERLTQLRAVAARAETWRLAGDAALRGPKDLAAARQAFERSLGALRRDAHAVPPSPGTEFAALVDLTLTLVRQGRPIDEVRALEQRANRAIPGEEGDEGALHRARLLLLAAALDARGPEARKGVKALEELARRPGTSDGWIELRRDAREELALLSK